MNESKEKIQTIGEFKRIPIGDLQNNDGQIKGVPKNPRFIRDDEFNTLKRSLTESPELLEYKSLMVYAMPDGTFVTICGNMRLRACREINATGGGFDTIPCLVLNPDTPKKKIKEYSIKDNITSGNFDWDSLANEDWDVGELADWGLDCDFFNNDEQGDFEEDNLDEQKEPMVAKITFHDEQSLLKFQMSYERILFDKMNCTISYR